MFTSRSPDQTRDGIRPQTHDDPEPPQQRLRITPAPSLQLLSVCVSSVVEHIAYSQIFPYVNQMIWKLGVTDDPKKVGYYSGMLESMFAFAQVLTVYGYGRLSDRIGRKPVVMFSVFGVALGSGLFGLSKSLAHMAAARTIVGLLSGYGAVIQSVLGETTDDTNQAVAVAYSAYALCYPIGTLIGRSLGKPQREHPILGSCFLHDLFDQYPYMLPSLVTCAVLVMSFTFLLLFMEETLPSIARRKARRQRYLDSKLIGIKSSLSFPPITERSLYLSTSTRVEEDELSKISPGETDALLTTVESNEDGQPHNWTVRELLKLPELRRLYRCSVILSFLAEGYVGVFVLFSYTEIQHGGLGFKPAEIGFMLAAAGGISVTLRVLVLPIILLQGEPTKTFKTCMGLLPIGYAIPPILNIIARVSSGNGQHQIGTASWVAIWTGIWVAEMLTKSSAIAYSMNLVVVRQCAPDQRALGATNGLNLLFMSGAKMFAPVTINALFALSTQHNWLGGHLVWVIMVGLSVLGWKASAWN
ncbi:major facilitator superfamily domain-containing protein [Rhizoctonia solani]|nr:major facilitator superfamily domain-containing protein [Rhizoctonia solani]